MISNLRAEFDSGNSSADQMLADVKIDKLVLD